MTRYLRESTPERNEAAAQWGVHDLRLRPADPTATGSFDYAYFRAIEGQQITNLSGTTRSVDWGPKLIGGSFTPGWEIGGSVSGVFRPRDQGGSTTVSDSEYVRWIDILQPGHVTICWGVAADFTGDAVNGDVYSMFTEDSNEVMGLPVYQQSFAAPSGVENTGNLISNYSRIFPIIDPFSSGSQTIQIRTLISWSGPTSGEDIFPAFIDIFWVGFTPDSGTLSSS